MAKKPEVSKIQKWKRLLGAVISPRAWLHLIKLLNFYNYSHVVPLRRVSRGGNCLISPTAKFAYGERIELGRRVLIGEDCRLWAGPSMARIQIGDDTMLGPSVLITAASYDYTAGAPISQQEMLEADVVIGRDVWIGAGAKVLVGSSVGDGAVIGANSVVRGHVPAMSVFAGAPARRVGDRFQSGS